MTIITYPLFLIIDFFSAPDPVESYLRDIGLLSVFPFDVSVDFILVFFNEKYSFKQNIFLTETALAFL